MIKFLHNTKRSSELVHLEKSKVGSWIHVDRPDDNEIEQLVSEFGLDEGLLRDALDPYEVPRIEKDEGNTYVYTRVPYKNDQTVFTAPILIILTDTHVVTLTQRTLPLWDRFLNQKVEFYTTQRIKFFFQMFTEITVLYHRFVTEIRKSVQASMSDFEDVSNEEIAKFVRFENTLNNFLGALVPTNTSLKNLLTGKYTDLYEEDRDLIEDVFLSNEQLIELCRTNLKAISNIRDAYSTIMTNNLNQVIKLLTALTIVFTIPTMIASFFGMNVRLPGEGHPLSFLLIVGVALLISLMVLVFFSYKKWLR